MTKTDELFDFTTVQPIFAAILPLLADYVVESLTEERCHLESSGSSLMADGENGFCADLWIIS